MRILLPCLDFPPSTGGIQTLLSALVRELSEPRELRDHEVTVIAPQQEGAAAWDRDQPFRVVRVRGGTRGSRGRRFAGAISRSLLAHVLRDRPDVVLCGHALLGPASLLARQLTGTPYVLLSYDIEFRGRWLRPMRRPVFRQAAAVLTISDFNDRVVVECGCPPRKLRRLPLGFDPARLDRCVDRGLGSHEEHAGTLGPAGKPWILCVARLDLPYKGVDTLLAAMPAIRSAVPGTEIVVVGSGPLRAELIGHARELGLEGAASFPGWVSDAALATLYRECTLFALISREEKRGAEGFGLVFLEAGWFGKAVLGGRSGGVPSAVLDGETGLLCDPTDPADVAAAAIRLLRDRPLRQRLGARGRERVERMTWANTASALEAVLGETLRPVDDGALR